MLVGLTLIVLGIVGAPSLVCYSPAGKSIATRAAASYGWDARVQGLRLGWITPLRLDGVELRGIAAGTEISIQQLQTELTLPRLLSSTLTDLRSISARGVVMALKLSEGTSSLEEDLAPLLSGPSSDTVYTGAIHVQDVGLLATDSENDQTWKLAQSNFDVELQPDGYSGQFAGVLTEPSGSGGALQGSAAYNLSPVGETPAWQLRLQCESLPISIVLLAKRRLGQLAAAVPQQISGDSTGRLAVDGFADGRVLVVPEKIEIRNFTAADPSLGEKVWSNQLAALDGALVIESTRIVGKQFSVKTDFAFARMDGAISTAFSFAGSNDNPVQWLDALNGLAAAELDLARLDRALPGMLPLRAGAEIISGNVTAQVDTLPGDGGLRRSRLTLTSAPIRARIGGQNVSIEPIDCVATVVNDRGQIAAEKFQFTSTFASASGQGNLRTGAADVDVDFGRLASTLRPIMDLPENSLAGTAKGNVRWNATQDNIWKLNGSGLANDVRLVLPSGQSFSRPSLRGDVSAIGRWDGRALSELSHASVTLSSSGINLGADLVSPVRSPSSETLMPIEFRGTGRIEALCEMLGPWMPAELHDCEGGFSMKARGDVSTVAGEILQAELSLTDPRAAYQDRYFAQPNLKFVFDGRFAWPSGELVARDCTLVGEALTGRLRGEATDGNVNIEIACETQLQRLQGSVRKKLARQDRSSVQPVGFRADNNALSDDWLVLGDVKCNLAITSSDDWLHVECQGTGKNLSVLQPPSASAASQTAGPMPPAQLTQNSSSSGPGAASLKSTVVWTEPNFKLDGKVRYRHASGECVADDLQLSGDWFAAKLDGRAVMNDSMTSVELRGPGKLKMDQVGKLLTSLAGTPVDAVGVHETPLEILYQQAPSGDASMNITGTLGWESAAVAGVELGRTSIPVRMTETSLYVSPSVIPLSQGQINLAGEAHYRPGPMWLRVPSGRFAESVRLTREMNERWLKYLAPLAADAAHIDGTVGVTLDEAIIVLDSPQQTRVIGQLNIEGIEMTAGPLSQQIIAGVDQLKAIARAQLPQATTDTNKTLVTMPAQTVNFSVANGVVTHERLFLQVDRAQVITSGQVSLDSRLNMVAQVPLDARWLGNDLQRLAGQPVKLPITGTLSRPTLDSAGVRQVVKELGTQALQGAAENLLQQQLGRGLDKIFGN